MFHPRTVTFTVTISPHLVRQQDLRHCIAESLRAYSGHNTHVEVCQVEDDTLEISISEAPSYNEAADSLPPYTNENV